MNAHSENNGREIEMLLSKCNRCGFCHDSCPTYRHSQNETQVARGRIQMIRSARNDVLHTYDPESAAMVDNCLLCRACVVNCPASVPTDEIIMRCRRESAAESGFSLFHHLVYRGLLPHRKRLELVGHLMRAADKGGAEHIRRLMVLTKAFETLTRMGSYLPKGMSSPARTFLKNRYRPHGRVKMRVGYFIGCATNVFSASVAKAIVRYLVEFGCLVEIPDVVCCGSPHESAGDLNVARELARRNINVLSAAECDVILSDCSTCAHGLTRYVQLLDPNDPAQEILQHHSWRIMDAASFIHEHLKPTPHKGKAARVVTYHDPCHAIRGLGVKEAPRELVRSIPNLDLVEMERADSCCGGAGSYCFRHPDMASRILAEKMTALKQTGASVLATACPACMLQLSAGIRQFGLDVDVRHPVELLAESAGLI
jgi:glycolate oxidase iron-sulfur subunit